MAHHVACLAHLSDGLPSVLSLYLAQEAKRDAVNLVHSKLVLATDHTLGVYGHERGPAQTADGKD